MSLCAVASCPTHRFLLRQTLMNPLAVVPGEGAFVPAAPGDLAFQKWLQASQWWSGERLLEHQLQLLQRLLAHAYRSVPFHRSRIDVAGIAPPAPLTLADWRRLPPLTRRDLQQAG